MDRGPRPTDVVVLGGGLAGLAAAVRLSEAGVACELLEARERVGGRVQTIRAPFDDGLYAEAGGEFISPGHEALRCFLRRYGLPARPRAFGPRVFYFGGQARRGWSLDDYDDPCPRRDAERIAREELELARQVPNPACPWQAPAAASLDARSVADWLGELELGGLARAHHDAWVTIDYGVEAAGLSLLMYARDTRLVEDSPQSPTECVHGGIDRLPRAMAAELGPRVHLATVGRALEQDEQGVSVEYARDGRVGRIESRYAVVAVPVGALRQIAISPPLDAERQAVLNGLHYGHVLKTMLQFRRRFWLDQEVRGVLTDLPIRAAYEATHDQPGSRGILTVYTAGHSAAELAALPEPERIARCLGQLEVIFPGCGAELERGVTTDWDADPASLGAYSHFAPGELTRYGPLPARPSGRLHFAGEHTDPWQATMNGALASGLRAADEVLTRLRAGY